MLGAHADKAYYFQEKTLIQQDAFLRSIQPVVTEMQRLLHKRDGIYYMLREAFEEDKDVESLRTNHEFKLCIRSILGLPKASLSSLQPSSDKPSPREEGWIYHLNIGNVMHLTPLDSEDVCDKLVAPLMEES